MTDPIHLLQAVQNNINPPKRKENPHIHLVSSASGNHFLVCRCVCDVANAGCVLCCLVRGREVPDLETTPSTAERVSRDKINIRNWQLALAVLFVFVGLGGFSVFCFFVKLF